MIHIVDKEKGIDMWAIDDSKMPTPEEVKNFPKTPEIDEQLEKEVLIIARECGLPV